MSRPFAAPAALLRWLALASALALFANSARADDEAAARASFERGYAALIEGRFPEARDLLRDSLARAARPATAFNLVLALLGTEEPVDAADVCAGLLTGAYGALSGEHRTEAERECARADAETSTVLLETPGATATEVRVDGVDVEPLERAGGALAVRLNPGAHIVSVTSADGRTARRRVSVSRGQTTRVSLRWSPPLEAPAAAPSDPPWLWIGLGAGAVVAAIVGGILIAVAVDAESAAQPIRDPVFGVVVALQ